MPLLSSLKWQKRRRRKIKISRRRLLSRMGKPKKKPRRKPPQLWGRLLEAMPGFSLALFSYFMC
jgi:hypothetical protein